MSIFFVFFFFKQKTAYEMRISDWSSDVCSSDLDDKPPVFEAHDLLGLSIAAMTGMVEKVTFRTDRMRALAESGFATATDLAAWLVREAHVPFREAHHITGRAGRKSVV